MYGYAAQAGVSERVVEGTGLEYKRVSAFADANVSCDGSAAEPPLNGGDFKLGDGELRYGFASARRSGREAMGSFPESAGKRPAEGVGLITVPMADKANHVFGERRHALETAAAQDAALKDAEPDLDLVDQRGVQWCVDEAESDARALC
jgi:hypothetical protein